MNFGVPNWFWLCASAIIPILIHLWNKKSGKPQLLGTFRFLPNEDFSKARSIQLHEIPLLLIRIAMIVTITFLLIGLLFETEHPFVAKVQIIQTDKPTKEQESNQDDSILKEVSSKEIVSAGWWNIISQVEHELAPEQIMVSGDFGSNYFSTSKPNVNTNIDWIPLDGSTPKEITSQPWIGNKGVAYQYKQSRSKDKIIANIEPLTNLQGIAEIPELQIVLSGELNENVESGIKFTLNKWGIDWVEQNISEVFQINFGEETRILEEIKSTSEEISYVEANAVSGISFITSNMDSSVIMKSTFMKANDVSLFGKKDEQTFLINGKVSESNESWVYAGITQTMLLEVLKIDEFLTPQLPASQREMMTESSLENGAKTKRTESENAQVGLFVILLLMWSLERLLAPKRGM